MAGSDMAGSDMAGSEMVVGHGPVRVIALHGWFGSSRGWGMLPELVDEDRFTYAFLDYRGYGERRDAAGDYTLEEISADARETADRLGWDRYALVGHSMGGAAALRTFADAPERVTAVVGVSPVPASGVPFDEQGRALFEGAAENPENRHVIIDVTTGSRHSATWLRRMVDFSVRESAPAAVAGYLRSWSGAAFHEQLPAPAVPVTAIAGAHDSALGPDTMEATWVKQVDGCTLEVLPDAGHYAMFETPVALVTLLEKSLPESP